MSSVAICKAEGSTKRGRVVCLDPAGSAFRGFVWKLCLVYASGVFDKSQILESIVGRTVIIGGGDTAGCWHGLVRITAFIVNPAMTWPWLVADSRRGKVTLKSG